MLTQEEMKEQDTDKMPEIVLEGIDIKQGSSTSISIVSKSSISAASAN